MTMSTLTWRLQTKAGGGADDEDPGQAVSTTHPWYDFINKMLMDAIKADGASDLHFEPFEKSYKVRFRTDGVLHEVARPPVNLAPRISARLKVMSQMDISERRVPQDGRIKLKISKTKAIDFRVNTLPVLFGEKLVLRILDPSSAKMGIECTGLRRRPDATASWRRSKQAAGHDFWSPGRRVAERPSHCIPAWAIASTRR